MSMTKFTIKWRTRQGDTQQETHAGPRLIPLRFAQLVWCNVTFNVLDSEGNVIGGNPGVRNKLASWNIKHPEINNSEITDRILGICERALTQPTLYRDLKNKWSRH